VRFVYLDGHKEKRLAQMQEPSISAAMMIRILDIDGTAPSKKALAEMSLRDPSALRQDMLSVDAGIDTTIESDCDDPDGISVGIRAEGIHSLTLELIGTEPVSTGGPR
jgi:hypothetical protein